MHTYLASYIQIMHSRKSQLALLRTRVTVAVVYAVVCTKYRTVPFAGRIGICCLDMADPERLREQVDIAQDEGLQITRNIRDIAVETHGIARDTAETLIQQGEQLDNVERRMGEMNADLKEADRNLREIEKCCGCCFCPGSRPKDFTKRKDYKKVYGKSDSDEEAIVRQPRSGQQAAAGDGQYVSRVLGDEREAEMNENLK